MNATNLTVLVTLLWLASAVAPLLPGLALAIRDVMRMREAPLFALFALALTCSVGRSIADKGGQTNPPPTAPAAPIGRINLYYPDASGRLIPLDATFRRIDP